MPHPSRPKKARPGSRGAIRIRDGTLPRLLARALAELGIPAVLALDLLESAPVEGLPIEELARGRTVVAWDLEYLDSRRFRLKDPEGVLVLRISEDLPPGLLARRIAHLVRDLEARGVPKKVLVLDLWTMESPVRIRLQFPARPV